MKKLIIILVFMFSAGTFFTSCRDDRSGVEKAADDIEDAVDDTGDAIEDAADDF